jgi:hypothetical protein
MDKETRRRMREEEIFRQEVRKELEAEDANKSKPKAVWKALNSSFAIWFLTTVVIGLITWSYAAYSDYRQAATRKDEGIQRLDTEIAGRVGAALNVIENMKAEMNQGTAYYPRTGVFDEVVKTLDLSPGAPRRGGVYPDFRERSFRSLLVELQRLESKETQNDLKAASAEYVAILSNANRGTKAGARMGSAVDLTPTERDDMSKAISEAREAVDKLAGVARWKSGQ